MSDLPASKPITQSIPVAQPAAPAGSEIQIPANLKEVEKLMVACARNKASDPRGLMPSSRSSWCRVDRVT